MLGENEKFFMASIATAPADLKTTDYLKNVTDIDGATNSEFDMVEKTPAIGDKTKEAEPGLYNRKTITITGNYVSGDTTPATLQALHEAQTKAPYGHVKEEGIAGKGGYCYVKSFGFNAGAAKTIVTWTAVLETTGDVIAFTPKVGI